MIGKIKQAERAGRQAELEANLLRVLSLHQGSHRPVPADVLYERVFGLPAVDKISSTRNLRKLINGLQREGVPIASTCIWTGGGYFLASGSELDDYLGRIHGRALRALVLESKIRKVSLAELLGQMRLRLEGESA